MAGYTKEFLRDLIDGKLDLNTVKRVMSEPKDIDRFDKYIEISQEKITWPERILLPLGEHLYIVQKGKERIVKCECGHEFGDYRINWKLNALIYVRDTEESLDEVYPGDRKPVNVGWCEIREYYCPGCGAQLEVEGLPPGYPVLFNFLPDLDGFYAEWLGRPLETKEANEDKSYSLIEEWAKEDE
jgi:acetone carboxylase gamma subunit